VPATTVVDVGQPVAVTVKPSSTPGILRFETNRNLTGQGHERFTSSEQAVGPRPAAVLARRLFDTGRVDSVHVYQNIVTVDLLRGMGADDLDAVVENLYIYYTPGFVLPTFDAPVEEAPAAVAAPSADGGPALDPRVPAHLWERSRLGMEKWRANHG
jgi:hypothetical protein